MPKADGITRLVALYDIHYPFTIPALFDPAKPSARSPILNFIADYQPHVYIDGGDRLHLDCISHWNRGKVKLLEGKRLSDDYAGMNLFLDRLDKVLDKSVKRKWMLSGNHDVWVDDLIEENPQAFAGVIEWQKCLSVKQRGFKVVEPHLTCQEGKMHFHHGDYKQGGYTPVFYARNIAQLYHRNIFFGHFHSCQSYIDVSPIDTHPVIAQGIGCLSSTNPEWMKNRPNAWTNSFLVAEIFPDGQFNHTVIHIHNGRFVYDGTIYQ